MRHRRFPSQSTEQVAPTNLTSMETVLRGVVGTGRVLITPEVAEQILEHWNASNGNRRLDEITVQRYRRDMDADRWIPGSVLAFGLFEDGMKLGDGQHRLKAQVVSKTSQEYGVRAFTEPEEFSAFVLTIDAGKARSLADQLRIFGVADSPGAASVFERVTNAMQLFLGERPSRQSKQERMDFATKYAPQIRYVLALPKREFKAHLLAAIVFARAKYPRETEALIAQVISGADLAPGSPALELSKAKVLWNEASLAAEKDRAVGMMMRVLFDGVRGKAKSSARKVAGNSSRVFEAIQAFCGAEVASQWTERNAPKARR